MVGSGVGPNGSSLNACCHVLIDDDCRLDVGLMVDHCFIFFLFTPNKTFNTCQFRELCALSMAGRKEGRMS